MFEPNAFFFLNVILLVDVAHKVNQRIRGGSIVGHQHGALWSMGYVVGGSS